MKNGTVIQKWHFALSHHYSFYVLFYDYGLIPIFCVKPKINTFDTETQNTTTKSSQISTDQNKSKCYRNPLKCNSSNQTTSVTLVKDISMQMLMLSKIR